MAKLKKGWEVRIIFILALGLAGTLASPHNPWMGLIGLAIGIIAAVLERLIVNISADKLVYMTTGSTVGLVVGILSYWCSTSAYRARNPAGVDGPSGTHSHSLAYVFAVVAVNKGESLNS